MTRAQPVPELTQAQVNAMHWDGKRRTIRDGQVRGLCVRINRHSTTYALQREHDGRTVMVTLGDTRANKLKDARAWALMLQSQFAQGIDPRTPKDRSATPDVPTLGEAWEARINWLMGNRRADTVEHSMQYRSKFADWLRLPMSEITTVMIRKRHAELTEKTVIQQRTKNGKCYDRVVGGPVTANNAVKVFSETWNWTHEAIARLPESPVPRRYLKHKVKSKPKAMTSEELIDWNEKVLRHPRRDLHLFTLLSGLRRRTLLALEWDWLGYHSIDIPAEYMKADRPFTLPLSLGMLEVLNRVPKTDRRIFPYAGIRSKSLPAFGHRLRHTYRTVAMIAGVPEVFIDMLMDHKVSADIGKVYTNPQALFDQLLTHQTEITENIEKMIDLGQ